jgi:prophage DNA circulation protein
MEATTAAVEAPTTTKSTAMEAAAAHAASVSTATAAAASVTAAATAATSECRSWLNQADRCQCEQGYNRFSHYAFPPLDEVAPRHTTLSQRDYSAIRQRSQ